MIFNAVIRNVLALILSMAVLGGLFYVSMVPAYMAVLIKFWPVFTLIGIPIINFITKLTSWKGDDSLWTLLKKRLKKMVAAS